MLLLLRCGNECDCFVDWECLDMLIRLFFAFSSTFPKSFAHLLPLTLKPYFNPRKALLIIMYILNSSGGELRLLESQ